MAVFDLHHIPNIKDSKKWIKYYNYRIGVAVSLLSAEHEAIKYEKNKLFLSARDLLAYEILLLKKSTNIPVVFLLRIIQENKRKFSNSFEKVKKK